MRKALIAVCAAVILLTAGIAQAHQGVSWRSSHRTGWTVYRTGENGSKVHTLWIRTRCVNGEDSAAHLRLLEYHDGFMVLGCAHRGY